MDRPQHLDLLVADGVGREVDRRLHGRERDELEQVVLDDVADRARLLVEAGAALDAERLGHRDLHVVDELAVPDRLEDAVAEAQDEHVLNRLLAEVVVDPVDLALLEVLRQDASFSCRALSRSWPNGFSTISREPAGAAPVLPDLLDGPLHAEGGMAR